METKVWKCEFEFECPKDWNNLQKTSAENVRFCDVCEKKVFFCNTEREAKAHSILGNCVAINATLADNIQTKAKPAGRQYLVGKITPPMSLPIQDRLKLLEERKLEKRKKSTS